MKSPLLLCLLAFALPLRADDPTLHVDPAAAIDTTPSKVPIAAVPNDNTVLTMDEEFTGGKLDDSRWNRWYPWSVIINREFQNYVLDAFEFMPEGGLRIRCDRRPFLEQKYSSGAMTTDGKFYQAYGYFEMKAKMPKGNGFWPAFWIMPPEIGKDGGAEIDILEHLGQDPNVAHTTLHSTDPVTHKPSGKGQAWTGPDFTADYHTFAVSWRPKDLIWLIDGVERFHIHGGLVPAVPEYLLLNLAVGGAWPHPPDGSTGFPGYLDVKYVKVYQFKDLPPVPPAKLRLGPTTVTPDTVHPGEPITLQTSIIAGNDNLPPMLARLYVTDFYGKKYLTEMDVNAPATFAGKSSASLSGTYTIPDDLAPGVYTCGIKVEFPDEPKLNGFTGCIYRFTVLPKPAAITK